VDNPAPAVNLVAPQEQSQSRSRSTATAKPIPWIERHVGEITAAAAGTILEALAEHQNGGLIQKTREQIGDSIWQLYRIRCVMVPTWNFDAICREQGGVALRAVDVAPATAQIAIDEVLRVLHAVIRETVN
jgi:hypothetical protein